MISQTTMEDCPICFDPLPPPERFLPECCRLHAMHISCARSNAKADRILNRPPLDCPICKRVYTAKDLERLLPHKRRLNLHYNVQPFDEQSEFQLFITETFDPSVIPETRGNSRSRIQRLAVKFTGLPVTRDTSIPHASQDIVVPPPPPPQQQQQQPQLSPLRQVLRCHKKFKESMDEFNTTVGRLKDDEGTRRRMTRSMAARTRRENRTLNRIESKLTAARGCLAGLNQDLIDYMLLSR